MNRLAIRAATAADEEPWRGLWQGYSAYYGLELTEEVTACTWRRLLDAASPLKGRIAIADDQPVGFALYQHHPSSWVAGDDCYLEDLFVAPEARGNGVGAALISNLIALARERGWQRLYWHAKIDNVAARALYDRFASTDGHLRYRMTL